jgi:hypothetical protein
VKWSFPARPSFYIRLIVIIGISLVLGVASIWLPPGFLFAAIAGIVFLAIAWRWPEIALLGLLVITSTAYDIYSFPKIPIGVGNLIITDVIMLFLIGVILLHVLADSKPFFIHTPLDLPILLFYGMGILSTGIAIFKSSVSFNQSLHEVRIATLYLTFFIVTNFIRDERRLRRLLYGLILMTALVAIAMIVQYILGDAIIILPGRVESLATGGSVASGVTRILPPGQSLALIGMISAIILLLVYKDQRTQILNILMVFVTGLAVLFTFNRNYWVSVGLAILILMVIVSKQDRMRAAGVLASLIIIGLICIVPLSLLAGEQASNLINSTFDRMASIFDPTTSREVSLQYRDIEIEYATSQIVRNPFIGLGFGASYRPLDSRLDPSYQEYGGYYIHNGHFYIMLKAGGIGYLGLLICLALFVARGLLKWKKVPNPLFRGVVLAFTLTIIGISVSATVNPIYMQYYWTPLLGIMMGTNEIIYRLSQV